MGVGADNCQAGDKEQGIVKVGERRGRIREDLNEFLHQLIYHHFIVSKKTHGCIGRDTQVLMPVTRAAKLDLPPHV